MANHSMTRMPPIPNHCYRIVVRYVCDASSRPYFAINAYSGSARYSFKPSRISSLEELLARLRSIIPEVDESPFNADECRETQVIFARYMELTDSQLAHLGLEPATQQ